ncbi:NADP-binding protein [Dacryopinax primogenitus]|uniref:NADP-binding protein n=1 Tax=Dacryopinax primogenitus (strain DJM 731) TaxID=1858805 RepID=M5GEE2_DACPD|nr:NADP-binding protein [Dacryopinax primogenitus]EJU03173.1 NADP-binding protein [Dacryopinax primogenitus]
MGQETKEPKVWFSALSGFGRVMTEHALAQGDNCVATSIDPSSLEDLEKQYGPSRLLNLQLDVTKPEEIISAFKAAKEHFGHVDIVLNNAGLGMFGIVEVVPEAMARKVFDVNFWGCVGVTKEAVRFFREENPKGRGGKLLVMSSATGLGVTEFLGYYSARRARLHISIEAITTAVACEIKPEWNIQVPDLTGSHFPC